MERTIEDIKSCFQKIKSLKLRALDLIQEMPKDEVGDNLEEKMELLKEVTENIKCKETNKKKKSTNQIIKCRYWNRGYCRAGSVCP